MSKPSPGKSPGRRRSSFVGKLISLSENEDTIERRLNHYACADAFHDFGDNFNTDIRCDPVARGLCDVRKGLPDKGTLDEPASRTKTVENADKELHTENEVLVEIFKNTQFGERKIVDDNIDNNIVQALIDAAIEQDGSISNIKLKGVDVNGETTEHSYTYNLFKDNKTYDIRKIIEEKGGISDTQSLYDFFGSDSAHIVVDAASISLVELIKSARTGNRFNIIRLINRELINDPAPKTYDDEQGYFLNGHRTNVASGVVRYEIYLERESGNIIYSSKSKSETGELLTKADEFGRGNFHSIYDFKLSDLYINEAPGGDNDVEGTYIANKLKNLPKLAVDIDLPGGPRIFQTSDPHETNSIESVNQRLDEIFAGSKDKHVNAAAHYQCKRSGDWFQALSCLDSSRAYWRAKRDGTPGSEIERITKYPIILVTHDRVLLAYALLLGVDVLFTYIYDKREEESPSADSPSNNRQKYLLYFKNEKNNSANDKFKNQLLTIKNAFDMIQSNKEDIAKFNEQIETWIETIQKANLNEIATAYEKAKQDHTKITNLVRAYIKFTNVDFQLADTINPKDGSGIKQKDRDLMTFNTIDNVLVEDLVEMYKNNYEQSEFTESVIEEYLTRLGLTLDKFNSIYANARAAQNVVRTRLHQKNQTPNIEALIASASSYAKSPLYFSTIPLNTVIKEMRVRGRGVLQMPQGPTNESRVAELVSYLTARMDNGTYARLLAQLDKLKTEHDKKLDNTLFGIFYVMIRTSAPSAVLEKGQTEIYKGVMNEGVKMMSDEIELKENLSRAAREQEAAKAEKLSIAFESKAEEEATKSDENIGGVSTAVAAVGEVEEAEIEIQEADDSAAAVDDLTEEAVSGLNASAKVEEKNLNTPESEKYDDAVRVVAEAEVAIGELDAKIIEIDAKLPENKKRRLKLSKPFNTIGTALTNFVGGVIGMFKKRSAVVAPEPAAAIRRRGGDDMNLPAKVLVVGYLRELRNSLVGFDSFGDFDYEYYEALAHVVRSIINTYKPNRTYFIRLAALLYNEIPNADFGPLFSNPIDARAMSTAVHSLTLASFGRASGEIPDLGYTSNINIDYKLLITSYNSFQQLRYSRRKDFLITSIGNLIKRFAYEGDSLLVDKSDELQALMSRMKMLTANSPAEPWMKGDTRTMVPVYGGATRRRKAGGSRAASAVNKGKYRRSLKRSTRKLNRKKDNNNKK